MLEKGKVGRLIHPKKMKKKKRPVLLLSQVCSIESENNRQLDGLGLLQRGISVSDHFITCCGNSLNYEMHMLNHLQSGNLVKDI